jgi:metallophosphoesterase (TIGR00282 family)
MPVEVRLLFLGDIVGRPGRQAVRAVLPGLINSYSPTLIVANGENAAGGLGITDKVCRELLADIDVLTSGNHIWDKKEAIPHLRAEPRLLRPANYPKANPGRGTYLFENGQGLRIGILNLQGRVFMEPVDCPFLSADEHLENLRKETPVIFVDFHAEATSEKQAMGWHLDGRVSAVIGTHTHVQTADERILPQGTAFITDVGMVGGYNSVIGINKEQALQRFLSARPQRFEPAKGDLVFSGLYVKAESSTGKAVHVERISIIQENDE